MASRRTPSPRVWAPKASAAWLRAQSERERAGALPTDGTQLALSLGGRCAQLRVDPLDHVPTDAIPLLP